MPRLLDVSRFIFLIDLTYLLRPQNCIEDIRFMKICLKIDPKIQRLSFLALKTNL